jgi:hypothetical protein
METSGENITAEVKGRVIADIQDAAAEFDISSGELRLLELLDRAGPEGTDLATLKQRFYANPETIQEPERNLRTMNSRLRSKVSRFFRLRNGKEFECVLRRSEPGRGKKGRYGLLWRPHSANVAIIHCASPELVDIAFSKLDRDFDHSALANSEVFAAAYDSTIDSIKFMVDANKGRGLEGRIPEVKRWLSLPNTLRDPGVMNPRIRARCSAILERKDLLINCECIECAAVATMLSLKEKYGLDWEILQADLSGRMQMVRLAHDDSAAFLVTANAPFFFMGEGPGLDYRFIGPVHAEEQVLVTRRGRKTKQIPDMILYTRSSCWEQYLNMTQNRHPGGVWGRSLPWDQEIVEAIQSAHIVPVESLVELVQRALNMEAGDFVFSWEPLTDGLLRRQPMLETVGDPYKHWISLYCHKNFLDCADSFLHLFAYEFQTCERFRERSKQLLSADEDFWHYIGGGSGMED